MKIPAAIAALAADGQLIPAQRRRFPIDLCLRRIQPGSGAEFQRRGTAMNPWPDLWPILHGIPLEALLYLGQVEMGKGP